MKFETINDLRNDVFHFRRAIMPRDTDKMRRFRDRIRNDHELRYNRELYNAKKELGPET